MREKVEAQGGVSGPAAGAARAVFASWGGQRVSGSLLPKS